MPCVDRVRQHPSPVIDDRHSGFDLEPFRWFGAVLATWRAGGTVMSGVAFCLGGGACQGFVPDTRRLAMLLSCGGGVNRSRRRGKGPQHRIFSSTSTLQSQLHVCFANSTRFGQLYALAANSMPWPPTLCSGGQLYALTANSML